MVASAPSRTAKNLKYQLQLAIIGAIGVAAGDILWETIFLREGAPLVWRFVNWLPVAVLAASTTLAWARGVCRFPAQAAKFGALTGAIVYGCVDLAFWFFEGTDRQPFSQRIETTILFTLRWWLYGFIGGLAIEKRWASHAAIGVGLGVGIAGVIATVYQIIVEGSIDQRNFFDLALWKYELSRQFLRAAGWALAIAVVPKSNDVLQRSHERPGYVGNEIDAALSREDTDKPGNTSRGRFKLQREVALTVTLGMTIATIIREAILEFLKTETFDWSLGKWTGIVIFTGFTAWISRKYFDPFIERLGGIDHKIVDRPRLRLSLHVIFAIAVIAFAMRLFDQAFERSPLQLGLLGLLYAFTAGSITLAWARGLRRTGGRAAEYGMFTGALLFSVIFVLYMGTWAMMLGRGLDEVIPRAVVFALEWGLYGLFGGLAIERRWGSRLAARTGLDPVAISVALTVGATGVLAGALLAFLTGTIADPGVGLVLLIRVFFVAAGWALGLMLFPRSEDVLQIRRDSDERGYVAPTS